MKRWIAILAILLLTAVLLPEAGFGEDSPDFQEAEDSVLRLPDEVLMTYYDNTIFAGDSQIALFRNFVQQKRKENPDYFAGVIFKGANSFKLRYATYKKLEEADGAHLTEGGQKATLYAIVKKLQPAKVFLLAGLNDAFTTDYTKSRNGRDITGYDRAAEYVEKIVAAVAEACPETKVYFISQIPVTKTVAKKRSGIQERWDLVNETMKAKCEETGAGFIDAASVLKGEDGLLPADLSRDGEYHLNDEGNEILVQILLDFAQAEYEAGNWTPGNLNTAE